MIFQNEFILYTWAPTATANTIGKINAAFISKQKRKTAQNALYYDDHLKRTNKSSYSYTFLTFMFGIDEIYSPFEIVKHACF